MFIFKLNNDYIFVAVFSKMPGLEHTATQLFDSDWFSLIKIGLGLSSARFGVGWTLVEGPISNMIWYLKISRISFINMSCFAGK